MCARSQSSWHCVLLNFGRCHSLNTRTTINFFHLFFYVLFFVLLVSLYMYIIHVFIPYSCNRTAIWLRTDTISLFLSLSSIYRTVVWIYMYIYAMWFFHAIYSIYLFSVFILFSFILVVIGADCMASCRHSDHINDTNARNHQKSSNGGHTRRETRLAIENTRCQRIGQRMVHGKLSHHFWHFILELHMWFEITGKKISRMPPNVVECC